MYYLWSAVSIYYIRGGGYNGRAIKEKKLSFFPTAEVSGLCKIPLKPFELLTYKFAAFPKYKFNMFSQNFSSIDKCLICLTGTF